MKSIHNNYLKKQIALLATIVLLFSNSFAQSPLIDRHIQEPRLEEDETLFDLLEESNTQLTDSLLLNMTDVNISTISSNFKDLYYIVYLELYVQSDKLTIPAPDEELKLEVNIELEGLKYGSGTSKESFSDTLSVSPSKDRSVIAFYIDKKQASPLDFDVLKKVRLAAAKNQLSLIASEEYLKGISLSISVKRGRYFFPSSLAISPKFYLHNSSEPTVEIKKHEAVIKWDEIKNPSSYEIEWIHIPFKNPSTVTSLNYDFTKNAVRLITENNFLPLNLLHSNGFIVVRGRTKRPVLNSDSTAILNKYKYGSWSLDDKGSLSVGSQDYLLMIDNSTNDAVGAINWQYRGNYTSDGKKKEVVNYFDGSNRGRQTNTIIYNDKTTIINTSLEEAGFQSTVVSMENYYDYNGEAVINVLPTPLVESQDISYQFGINKKTSNKLLKTEYDGLLSSTAESLTSDSVGASNYYSVENTLLSTSDFSAFIPDADGYPYTRLEYMTDGSGRLKAQYGLGSDKANNATKGTQFAYARPLRGEIERLFGSNLGEIAFYKKDYTIDPNGLMSVAYKDIKNRVVASSVAGVAEGRSEMLGIDTVAVLMTENLLTYGIEQYKESEHRFELSFPFYVAVGSNYRFEYNFKIDPFIACGNSTICFDCRYKFTLQIIDEENKLVLQVSDSLVDFQEDGLCLVDSFQIDVIDSVDENYSASIIGDELVIGLSARKSYTLVKSLELITDSLLEQDAAVYLEDDKCGFLDYTYFENDQLNKTPFEQCMVDNEKEAKDFCGFIYENLRKDFLLPDGYFVKNISLDDDYFGKIYDRVSSTLGCRSFFDDDCYKDRGGFNLAMENMFYRGNGDYDVYYENRNLIAESLVKVHPNYCQYQICLDKFSTYETFDLILEESNSLEEFIAMGDHAGLFNKDTLNFYWDDTAYTYKSYNNDSTLTFRAEEVLFHFDDALRYIDPTDSVEYYNHHCTELKDDGIAYYSMPIFNHFVRGDTCLPQLDDFNKAAIYQLYFDNLFYGCEGDISNPTVSLYEAIKAIYLVYDTLNDKNKESLVWGSFKGVYLTVRDAILEDMLSSLVCVDPSIYKIDPDPDSCSIKTDTSGYIIISYGSEPSDPAPDTLEPGCLPINLGCINDLEEFVWNTPYSRFYPTRKRHKAELDSLLAFQNKVGVNETQGGNGSDPQYDTLRLTLANQVLELLKANNCYGDYQDPTYGEDSAVFVSIFNDSAFVCNPFHYFDTTTFAEVQNIISNCDLFLVNLASLQRSFMFLQRDSGNFQVPRYGCKKLKEYYTYSEFLVPYGVYTSQYSSAHPLPTITSYADIDISNVAQKKFANILNSQLAMNLSFLDYYTFIIGNTHDSTISIFGDSVITGISERELEIREVVIDNPQDVNYKEISKDSLIRLLNIYLAAESYDTINPAYSCVGFGEVDYENSQNDLYFFEGGQAALNAVADTFNYLLTEISTELDLTSIGYGYANKLFVDQYRSVANLSNLLIDRVYIYSEGTIWIRTLNASDSTFYQDFYVHYIPDNLYYSHTDVYPFDTIYPVFQEDEMKYFRMGFEHRQRNYSLLASKSIPISGAEKLSKVVLTETMGGPQLPLSERCEDLKYYDAIITAHVRYQEYLDSLGNTFKNNYIAFCTNQSSNKAIRDREMLFSFENPERHFTLYYYDQADNLVMTIPPGGFDTDFEYTADSTTKIANFRNNIGQGVFPNHSKKTTYKYNTDNQVIRQVTPNSDTSYFWYDQSGRMVLSSNAKQQELNKFSYSSYDELNRIVETGEVRLDTLRDKSWGEIHAFIVLELLGDSLISLDELILKHERNHVVKNFYDEPIAVLPNDFVQRNLRNRVATSAYYPKLDSNSTLQNWSYATHFSYDPTGNVKTLINDFYQEGAIEHEFHRFKRLDYTYDVISGNMLQVHYQIGKDEAFHHRYQYDAENRIIEAKSSRDGIIWDQDATYEYYLHGPLARTVIGQNKVQGIDYAYTLEGWLKTINAGHKNADIGGDFNKNNPYAADAFGMALHYNQFDYNPIGGNSGFLTNADTVSEFSDLYNGNISAISMHNQSMSYGKQFRYDQLNRLRSMREKSIDETSLNWLGDLAAGYLSFYNYDPSGNLTHLQRFDGQAERHMDDFVYHYTQGTDQLTHVEDTVDPDAFDNDIDNQLADNYSYDKIGNLTADVSEDICYIGWYPNGKVEKIIRNHPNRERNNLYFDYDPMGNRIKKRVTFMEEGRYYVKSTYYIRDAQGNIMSTYDERDCNLFLGDDSTGVHYYQYSHSYLDYTQMAMDSVTADSVFWFLVEDFSRKDQLWDEATALLPIINGIRDTIIACMSLEDYLNFVPQARNRLINANPTAYADFLYNDNLSLFVSLMNDRNEAAIQYLIISGTIFDFYADINDNYDLVYGGGDSYELEFYLHNRSVIASIFDNMSLVMDVLELTSGQYYDLQTAISDPNYALSLLISLMQDLENNHLQSQTENATTQEIMRMINALLLMVEFNDGDLYDVLNSIGNIQFFYDALNWMQPDNAEQMNALLCQMFFIDEGQINKGQLGAYKPGSFVKWTADTGGELLAKWLFVPEVSANIRAIFSGYFTSGQLNTSTNYFLSGTARPFVKAAMLRHVNNNFVKNAFLELESISLNLLLQTESTASLVNYYSTYLPKKVIKQAYYYDSLQLSFDGFPHYNPLLYAAELESRFGIKFDSMPACSSITKYMLPRTYDIYGSRRLGTMQASSNRNDGDNLYSRKLGGKGYEITDHLGNVHAVISDRKLWPQDTMTEGFQAEVLSRSDYYPFGMEIGTRSDSSAYRYGYQGSEKDDEIAGSGNSYTAEFWQYDSRLGRRWNTDPKVKAHESPYATFSGNPIWFVDPDGADTLVVHRSGPIAEMSDGNSTFYIVTFSMISDGVSTTLPGRMLMLANANSENSIPHTSLPNDNYKLTVQNMPSHSQFDGAAINVNKGVYIHQGNTYKDFAGCLGVCEDIELTTWNYDDGTSIDGLGGNTRGAVENIIEMRNTFDEYLTGDKFILQTNSTAPEIQKMKPKPLSNLTPKSTEERTVKTR